MKLKAPPVCHKYDVSYFSTPQVPNWGMRLNCIEIDFEDYPFKLGQKIPELTIDGVTFYDVVPLSWSQDSPTVARCVFKPAKAE